MLEKYYPASAKITITLTKLRGMLCGESTEVVCAVGILSEDGMCGRLAEGGGKNEVVFRGLIILSIYVTDLGVLSNDVKLAWIKLPEQLVESPVPYAWTQILVIVGSMRSEL